jgi:cardiolipin synthase
MSLGGLERTRWRYVPNAISIARIGAAPVLVFLLVQGDRPAFTWLLLAALLSDIADGLIARTFNLKTNLGAMLDSTADVLTTIAAGAGVVVFEGGFVGAHSVAIATVIGLYIAELLCSLLRYGRVSSFHTTLVRVTAYTQGTFVMTLLFWGYRAFLFYPAVAIGGLAYIEELILLYLLPRWQTDVGGVYRLIAARRSAAAE